MSGTNTTISFAFAEDFIVLFGRPKFQRTPNLAKHFDI